MGFINRFNLQPQAPGRKNARCSFRPFHEADFTRIQAVFHPRPDGFIRIFYPVQINMINRSARISIFIDDGECGTAYRILYLFYFAERMDKSCFSGAKLSAETEYFLVIEGYPEFFCQGLNG